MLPNPPSLDNQWIRGEPFHCATAIKNSDLGLTLPGRTCPRQHACDFTNYKSLYKSAVGAGQRTTSKQERPNEHPLLVRSEWCSFSQAQFPINALGPVAFGSAGQHACLTTRAASDRLRGALARFARKAKAWNGMDTLGQVIPRIPVRPPNEETRGPNDTAAARPSAQKIETNQVVQGDSLKTDGNRFAKCKLNSLWLFTS